jgi:uroporphyrinogen decarboxylase
MNGKERIKLALARQMPDMVPIWEMAFNEPSIIGIAKHFVDESQLPAPKLIMDMNDEERFRLIAGLMALIKGLDLDGMTATSLAPRTRLDREHMKDSLGVVYHLSEFGEPYPVEGPIKSASDLTGFRMRPVQDADFLMLDVFRKAFPERAVAYHMPGTFKLSWTLRGSMEQLLMDYLLDPALAHSLARLSTDYCFDVIDAAFARGADFIVLEGDLAYNPGPLMSPDHYREFIMPYHRDLCSHAHLRHGKIVKHSDGKLTPLVPLLIDAGFDGIHPIQPQCMDIGQIKKEFGEHACILGNIDCSFLLVFGSPEEVKENVRQTIAQAAPGGGYIISSSNSIHPGVKPENYISMVEAARKYGKYPVGVGA